MGKQKKLRKSAGNT